ncbi:type I glyceraldehyde-3-phosphate dehydrogenase [bacterium]|jgi:glyceraldehyde 3-phosphate dehydrogenase|nr:type I glyceraldehyde-3-phosphate dehydrogenase [bacterium]
MRKKVAINGFGRIGRASFRANLKQDLFDVVAINDLSDIYTTVQLLKYDSSYGTLESTIEIDGDYIVVDGKKILHLTQRDPSQLPWKELEIDVVLECTGIFKTKETAGMHLQAGAKKVVLSAAGKDIERTIVLGVNQDEYQAETDNIISNASCTTNCAAPIVMLLDQEFGIESGYLSTVHSYTASQNILDNTHKDFRRARTAATNIIPTSTSATKAIGMVLPQLEGKLTGQAYRVPCANGSIIELNVLLSKSTTVEEVHELFKAASQNQLKGILDLSSEQLVSSDYVGNPYSSVIDMEFTHVLNGKMLRILSWYDNEYGYSNRLIELANMC